MTGETKRESKDMFDIKGSGQKTIQEFFERTLVEQKRIFSSIVYRMISRDKQRYAMIETIERLSIDEEGVIDFVRASGLVVCPNCGLKLYDHPHLSVHSDLTLGCDGRIYKL